MKQVLIRRGEAILDDVPAPGVEPGTLLVHVQRSCVSIGTELSGLTSSGLPLWRRALKQPDQVRKAIETATTLGWARTWSLIDGRLAAGAATGYSAAGVVAEAGAGVDDIRPGDRVACAGAQSAHHAEIIRVPRNLTALIPGGLDFDEASTVTLGAIALQGVRRAQPTLGETFVVIGLGILGQLTSQLLRSSGCRVVGTDLDRARIDLAMELGMELGIDPDAGPDIDQVARLTGGIGCDGVIITAATPSDSVVSTAFKMCRRKGRVVLVGDVGLHLNRADFYQKEIDFLISSSYGPGRYDANYEEKGLDYPVAYVRWTENRNMAEYLRLLAEGRVRVRPLVSASYPVDQATAAYESLKAGANRPLMVLLSYPETRPAGPERRIPNPKPLAARDGAVRVALVGAGGFAKATHLPNLHALGDLFHLRAVVSRTGHNAMATARQWGADYAATDYREVLSDSEVDAVIIATRHHLHAEMALAALDAGKHVLVEKPLALTNRELDAIERWFSHARAGEGTPILLTGFNRRFSPYARRMLEWLRGRSNPMMLNYRMNAGHIPLDHWVHTTDGGGRNLGEACHIYDLFTFLTGSKVVHVSARGIKPATAHYSATDNFLATLAFEDGSVASLTYTALGSRDHAKERLEVYVDSMVIELDDYKALTVSGARKRGLQTRVPHKGQKEELEAFARAIQTGEWPIPLWQQSQATTIGLEVERRLH